MRHSPSRRRSGFTLLELLITLSVFGAVALISVRGVGDTLRRERVSKVSAILATDIEQGFSIAARQRLPVRMMIDRTNNTFTIVDRNTPTLIYKTRSFARSGEYAVDSVASNRDTIDIMPNGLATDTLNLSLIIRTRGGEMYSKSVRASIGGLVRVNNR
jgi:prepilin-type N-terminal cleavage/methylation domain-containing protein